MRAEGSASARQQACALIQSWAKAYRKPHKTFWQSDLLGQRLSLWAAHHDFFAADGNADFDDLFFASFYAQAQYLAKLLQQGKAPPSLRAIKGLMYAAIALGEQPDWLSSALALAQPVLTRIILPDGMHASRSAHELLTALKLVLEMRMILQNGNHDVPDFMDDAITRMTEAVKFFRYGDRHFGLFHGTMRGDRSHIDSVLAQAAARSKKRMSLPDGGYEKATLGRTLLMFDVGRATMHRGPLAFELANGKDRIFTNCGSHMSSLDWQMALSGPAAHNTLTIDGNLPGGSCQVQDIKREEDRDFCYLEAAHDGYISQYGLVHRRSLYLSNGGHDLRGEDTLLPAHGTEGPAQPYIITLRFHIHPRVLASLTSDGQAALLRVPSGIGWRFQQVGGLQLSLEESLYAGDIDHPPRKGQQLVITAAVPRDSGSTALRWALQREGL